MNTDIDQALLRAFTGCRSLEEVRLQEWLGSETKIPSQVVGPESNRMRVYQLTCSSWFLFYYCYEFGWYAAMLNIDPVKKTWQLARDAIRVLCRDPEGMMWDEADVRDILQMELKSLPSFHLTPLPSELPLPHWPIGDAIFAACQRKCMGLIAEKYCFAPIKEREKDKNIKFALCICRIHGNPKIDLG